MIPYKMFTVYMHIYFYEVKDSIQYRPPNAYQKLSKIYCVLFISSYDEALPEHLRVYTAGSVWVRVLTLGVELMQFVKDYTAATEQLETLLAQTVYHPDYRGRWYDRLALNLDHHLKERDRVSQCSVIYRYHFFTSTFMGERIM